MVWNSSYILITLFSGGCWGDEHEARLMRHLMANYDAAVRPVENSSLPLTVIFGVSLHHIIDVVSKNICSALLSRVMYLPTHCS